MPSVRLLLLLLVSVPAAIAAQMPSIPLGTRVRVEMLPKGKVVGTLLSRTDDSTVIATRQQRQAAVGTASIARIRVSGGRSHARGAVRGMKVGALVGGVSSGVVIGGASALEAHPDFFTGVAAVAAWSAAGAAVGTLYGALIGGIVGAEKWTTAYVGPTRSADSRTRGGATGVGLSIRVP